MNGTIVAAYGFDDVTECVYLSSYYLGLASTSVWFMIPSLAVCASDLRVGRPRVSRPGFGEVTEFGSGLSEFFG
jgi:hypothetical protein